MDLREPFSAKHNLRSFEHFIHTEDAAGNPLTSEHLSKFYGELIYENTMDQSLLTTKKSRMNGQESPIFTIIIMSISMRLASRQRAALAKRIVEAEPDALEKYLTYLKSGSSDYPIEVMKKAVVDMTQPTYIEDAMEIFARRLDELEELVEVLKN